MFRVSHIIDLFRVRADKPELAMAQFKVFSRQLPLMYGMLIINSAFLGATFFSAAPFWLTVEAPAVLYVACIARLALWWRSRHVEVSGERAVAELRRTAILSPILGVVFSAWALSLFQYGNAYQQAHVAFYMAITVIGCIFSLIQLRAAALSLVLVVLTPFAGHFALSGNPVFMAIAANMILVSIATIFVVLAQYRTFADLIQMQGELIQRNNFMKALSDANQELANVDSLTGLPNRRYFFGELESLLTGVSASEFSLGIIDLDGFKPVNDLYGHTAGDKILAEAAQRIRAACASSIFVARLGGDEFVLLCDDDAKGTILHEACEKVAACLREPFNSLRTAVYLSGSIGIAVRTTAGDTGEQIYEQADYALYHAKQNSRGHVITFSEAHRVEFLTLRKLEQALFTADLRKEMHVVFQPVVDIAAGRIKGFEALARWLSESLGEVPPSSFIRAAERSGTITQLTPILLEKALCDLESLPRDITLSFNLSVHDLCSPETVVRILSIVRAAKIDPQRLSFEVTESAIMVDFEQACEALKLFRNLGVKIALDDFGTGYSSLVHVHRLPLDTIKIDRMFVKDIDTNPVSRSLVRSIVDMSSNLGIGCIVEGMETARQVEVLRSLGVTHMQGYFFGRPCPVAQALDLCREGLPAESLPAFKSSGANQTNIAA